MITERMNHKLFKMFVSDPFNWRNSKFKVYNAIDLKHPDYKKLFWTPDEIENPYASLNSMGYRSDEFVENRDIVFAGCSQTWGDGVVLDGIWGNILSKSLNKKSYNLGLGARSVQFIVQNTIAFCKEYGNPKVIFCLFPDFTRIEMKSDASFMVGKFSGSAIGRHQYNIVPSRMSPVRDTKYSKAPHLAEDMIPSEFIFSVNLDYIHMLELYCKSNSIKLFWGTWDEWQEEFLHKNIDSMDFKNYVYLEQEKWKSNLDIVYKENFYDNDNYLEYKKCHEEYREKYGMNFDFAMDANPKSGLPGEHIEKGHMAVHRHIHVAEKFEKAFKNDSN